MAKCAFCGERAAVQVSYLNAPLCADHFVEFFERRFLLMLRRYRMVEPGDVVAVAASGGKDSLTTLYLMKKFSSELGYEVFALAVDEGIRGYREHKLRALREVAAKLGVRLYVVSFEEAYGATLDEMVEVLKHKGFEYKPCSVCGVFRRYLLNIAARELGATKVATGHNLDDEAQVFLMNVLRSGVPNIVRESPVSLGKHPKLVTRIKPLFFVPEKETLAYSLIKRLHTPFVECPYVVYSVRHVVRRWLNREERERPGAKYRLIASSLIYSSLLSRTRKAFRPLSTCKVCGEPASSELCKACEFRRYLGLREGPLRLHLEGEEG